VALSKTWQARLRRSRRRSGALARLAVAVGAVLGAAAACQVFVTPAHPDIGGIAQQTDNRQAQVGGFAADFVVTWLTATTADRASLQRFITIGDGATLALPTTPAAVITAPHWVSVVNRGTAGDTTIYAATVSVNERPYASASPTRAFYRVGVAMWNYQLRVIDVPARINDPGPGVDVKTGYPNTLSADSPLRSLVSGFIATYLTATTGLDRYVVAGSSLAPIGGYQTAVLTSVATDRPVPSSPAPGEQVHVLAHVTAQTSQFATINFAYPLTVENTAGTWMVAAIDLTPEISGNSGPAGVGSGP
jgi:Conjugative transposon protein TcpC